MRESAGITLTASLRVTTPRRRSATGERRSSELSRPQGRWGSRVRASTIRGAVQCPPPALSRSGRPPRACRRAARRARPNPTGPRVRGSAGRCAPAHPRGRRRRVLPGAAPRRAGRAPRHAERQLGIERPEQLRQALDEHDDEAGGGAASAGPGPAPRRAACDVADGQGAHLRVNGDRLCALMCLNHEPVAELLRAGDDESVALADLAAHIVGPAAAGDLDLRAPLDWDDAGAR